MKWEYELRKFCEGISVLKGKLESKPAIDFYIITPLIKILGYDLIADISIGKESAGARRHRSKDKSLSSEIAILREGAPFIRIHVDPRWRPSADPISVAEPAKFLMITNGSKIQIVSASTRTLANIADLCPNQLLPMVKSTAATLSEAQRLDSDVLARVVKNRKLQRHMRHHSQSTEIPRIVNMAIRAVHCPVKWTGEYSVATKSASFSELKSAELQFIERVSQTTPFNPKNHEQRDHIRLSCIADAAVHPRMWNFIENGAGTLLAVAGNRGSGKTCAINTFLNANWDHLQARGIAVFRTDVSKLNAVSEKGQNLSLQHYSELHTYYVALKHPTDSLLAPFSRESEFLSYIAGNVGDDSRICVAWRLVRRHFKEAAGISAPSFCASLAATQEARDLDEHVWRSLFHWFARFLRAQRTKVFYVIDGIDNVSPHFHGGRYNELVDQLVPFCYEKYRTLYFDYLCIALRNDTLHDLRARLDDRGPPTEAIRQFEVVQISEIPLRRILASKIGENAMRSSYSLGRAEQMGVLKDLDQRLKILSREAREFLIQLRSAFSRSLFDSSSARAPKKSTLDAAFACVFNRNVRCLLRNLNRSLDYVGRNSPGALVHGDLARVNPARLLAEGSILAGCNFFPSNESHTLGRWCPNLFQWSLHEGSAKWLGLVNLRIIQFYKGAKIAYRTRHSCVRNLAVFFGFPDSAIESSISMLFGAGVLAFMPERVQGTDGKHYPLVQVTDKGMFVERLFFRDLEVLYFSSLTVLLSSNERRRARRSRPDGALNDSYPEIHDPNKPVLMRAFRIPSIIGCITLLRHIIDVDKSDQARLETAVNLADVMSSLHAFRLPDLADVVSEIVMRVVLLNDTVVRADIINYLDSLSGGD